MESRAASSLSACHEYCGWCCGWPAVFVRWGRGKCGILCCAGWWRPVVAIWARRLCCGPLRITVVHPGSLSPGGVCSGRRSGWLALPWLRGFGEWGILHCGGRLWCFAVICVGGLFWWSSRPLHAISGADFAARCSLLWFFLCGGMLAERSGFCRARIFPGMRWPGRQQSGQRVRRARAGAYL